MIIKKLIAFAAAAAVLFSFVSCGKTDDESGENVKGDSNAYSEITENDELCFSMSQAEGNSIKVRCENKSDRELEFTWSDSYVNGYQMNPDWSETVAAGEAVDSTVTFLESSFEKCGIDSIEEIKYILNVTSAAEIPETSEPNDETDEGGIDESANIETTPSGLPILGSPADEAIPEREVVFNETMTYYADGKNAENTVYSERRTTDVEKIFADTDDCTMVILDTNPDSPVGFDFNCYIENKSDKTILFAMRDVSVNGKSVSPMWAKKLLPGMRAYSKVSFTDNQLEKYGITDVEDLKFNLYVSDYNDLSDAGTLVDSICEYTVVK